MRSSFFSSPDFGALVLRAASSPRHRINLNLHSSQNEPCQRIFNALLPDSYVRPHRHLHPDKSESLLLVRGRLGFVEFDDAGHPVATRLLLPAQALHIPAGVWHTCLALDAPAVFFEAKAGPYLPLGPGESAPFAPDPAAPSAPPYLASLRALFPPAGDADPSA